MMVILRPKPDTRSPKPRRIIYSERGAMDLTDFRRFFAYDDWANREVIASFHAVGTPPTRSLTLLAHILGTEYVWYSRLISRVSPFAVWPQLSVANCEQHAIALKRIWEDYLNDAGPDDLQRGISYKNTKGESFTNSVADILTHVVMHSAYHRGQIASDMRSHGHTPAYTDFIHAVRQKNLE
jgi:uncharacterized damage-inducible protein DinB